MTIPLLLFAKQEQRDRHFSDDLHSHSELAKVAQALLTQGRFALKNKTTIKRVISLFFILVKVFIRLFKTYRYTT